MTLPLDMADFTRRDITVEGKARPVLLIGDTGPAIIVTHEAWGFTTAWRGSQPGMPAFTPAALDMTPAICGACRHGYRRKGWGVVPAVFRATRSAGRPVRHLADGVWPSLRRYRVAGCVRQPGRPARTRPTAPCWVYHRGWTPQVNQPARSTRSSACSARNSPRRNDPGPWGGHCDDQRRQLRHIARVNRPPMASMTRCGCYGGCPSGAGLRSCGYEANTPQPGAPDGHP
jgi:hypothetical protein